MGILLIALYLTVLLLLCCYGLHPARLTWLCWRCPPPRDQLARDSADASLLETSSSLEGLPTVTVQLPIYNEATVVQRLLDAVNRLEYPRDKLEIQVLDDSDDETRMLAESAVDRLRAAGLDILYVR